MRVVVSFLSSKYSFLDTIKKISETDAFGIHVDLMDGLYAGDNNIDYEKLDELKAIANKPLDIHLMVYNPENYLDYMYKLNPVCIYIHPKITTDVLKTLKDIKNHGVDVGICINPNENIEEFEEYFKMVDRVLLMSVNTGYGGQEFIPDTKNKLDLLSEYREKYNFEIYVDGGINDKTIKDVEASDGVVVGSYICNSDDYEGTLKELQF